MHTVKVKFYVHLSALNFIGKLTLIILCNLGILHKNNFVELFFVSFTWLFCKIKFGKNIHFHKFGGIFNCLKRYRLEIMCTSTLSKCLRSSLNCRHHFWVVCVRRFHENKKLIRNSRPCIAPCRIYYALSLRCLTVCSQYLILGFQLNYSSLAYVEHKSCTPLEYLRVFRK